MNGEHKLISLPCQYGPPYSSMADGPYSRGPHIAGNQQLAQPRILFSDTTLYTKFFSLIARHVHQQPPPLLLFGHRAHPTIMALHRSLWLLCMLLAAWTLAAMDDDDDADTHSIRLRTHSLEKVKPPTALCNLPPHLRPRR